MRSFLFVPGDSQPKFRKARGSDADALILDLEDSVALGQKAEARRQVVEILQAPREGPLLFVRVNSLDTGMTLDDLAAIMPYKPDGIVLPKCESPDILRKATHYLAALEAAYGADKTPILAIVTETAASLFSLGHYKDVDPRLWGMMWGAEDLAASLRSRDNGARTGYHEPFRLARNLCLAGAAVAGVVAVDTICAVLDDLEVVQKEAEMARRDGFGAKAVIHPKHIETVNQAFAPSEDELSRARRIWDAFAKSAGTGVVQIDGQMIDKPHAQAAQVLLSAAGETLD